METHQTKNRFIYYDLKWAGYKKIPVFHDVGIKNGINKLKLIKFSRITLMTDGSIKIQIAQHTIKD